GVIDQQDLERALAAQAESGKKLGALLLAQGSLTAAALTRALAEQCGVEPTAQTGFGNGLMAAIDRRQGLDADMVTERVQGEGRPCSSHAIQSDRERHDAYVLGAGGIDGCPPEATQVEPLPAYDELLGQLEAQAQPLTLMASVCEEREHVFAELAAQK